jgi:hypothetical protein
MRWDRSLWPVALVLLLVGGTSGCSNDFMNTAVWSDETRMRKFREHHDRQVGEPFYGREEEVCGRHQCTRREDDRIEIVQEDTFEEGCSIAWVLDPSVTGKYHHRNGLELDIVGIKRSWRYVSAPDPCLYGLDWEGPW